MNTLRLKRRAITIAAAAALTLVAVSAPTANAGLLVSTASDCDTQQLSQPFAPWADFANYTPVPGGSFEAGAPAWTLTGGAKVVSGNESFGVRSKSDSRSLSIPQGSTATSRSICVGLGEPTLRWFQKQSGGLLGLGSLTSAMTVEVLFEDSLGQTLALPIGAGALNSGWAPSLPAVVTANLLPLLPGQKTAVAFRFRALTGNWTIDDVYVDPYSRN
jgi:hypothetical protein